MPSHSVLLSTDSSVPREVEGKEGETVTGSMINLTTIENDTDYSIQISGHALGSSEKCGHSEMD